MCLDFPFRKVMVTLVWGELEKDRSYNSKVINDEDLNNEVICF